jgi:Arc/MetJ-type ribon-helix-helix transcriptional regulator
MTDAEEMVAFRIPPADRAAIQRLLDAGQFHNRSDFLRYAVKAALKEFPAPAAQPRLPDLEGVDLPDSAPARAPRATGRARKGVNL